MRDVLVRLGRLGLLATCVTVDLEVLYSARNHREFEAIAKLRATGFTDLPMPLASELAKCKPRSPAAVTIGRPVWWT